MRIREDSGKTLNTLAPIGGQRSFASYGDTLVYFYKNNTMVPFSVFGVAFTPGIDFTVGTNKSVIIWIHPNGAQSSSPPPKFYQAAKDYFAKQVALKPGTVNAVSTEYFNSLYFDVVTPNFTRRRNAGEIINNPMSSLYVETAFTPLRGALRVTGGPTVAYRNIGPGYGAYRYDGGLMTVSQPVFLLPTGEAEKICDIVRKNLSSPRDSAIAGAYAKLQKADLDVAMMALEGRETLGTIAKLIRAVLRLLRLASSPKTLKLAATRAYAKWKKQVDKVGWSGLALADAYLEVRYAIRPLIYDIQDIMDYFYGNGTKDRQNRYTYRKNEVSQDTGSHSYTLGDGSLISYSYSADVTARAGIISERRIEIGGAKFGFLNLASLAWEKVKFSFILDWIINISGLLYQLNPNPCVKPLAAWVKVTTVVTISGTYTPVNDASSIAVPFRHSYRHVARDVVTEPPMLSIDINFDFLKFLDLIAIAGKIKAR